jgi:hypothetical protein
MCHWRGSDHRPLGPGTLDLWDFYIIPIATLEERHPHAKTISQKQVRRLVQDERARKCSFAELRDEVDAVLNGGCSPH